MNTRQTSIDCYNQIKTEGLIQKQQLAIYSALFKLGKPSTAREVYASMNVLKQESTRFSELRKLGIIYEVGSRKCGITGRNAIEWDLTDRLPIKTKRADNTKKQRVKNAINALHELYKCRYTSTDEDWKNVEELINSI
jgi:hypothetical protein